MKAILPTGQGFTCRQSEANAALIFRRRRLGFSRDRMTFVADSPSRFQIRSPRETLIAHFQKNKSPHCENLRKSALNFKLAPKIDCGRAARAPDKGRSAVRMRRSRRERPTRTLRTWRTLREDSSPVRCGRFGPHRNLNRGLPLLRQFVV